MTGLPAPKLETLRPGPPPYRTSAAASVHVLLDELAVWRAAARSSVALSERDVQLLHERRIRAASATEVSWLGVTAAAEEHQRQADNLVSLGAELDALKARKAALDESLIALRRVAATQVEVIERELERGKGILGQTPSSDRSSALRRALHDARAAEALHLEAHDTGAVEELLEQLTRRHAHLHEAVHMSAVALQSLKSAHELVASHTARLDAATETAHMLLDAVRYRRSLADATAGIGELSAAAAFDAGTLRLAGDLA
jgi:hypothetical protein